MKIAAVRRWLLVSALKGGCGPQKGPFAQVSNALLSPILLHAMLALARKNMPIGQRSVLALIFAAVLWSAPAHAAPENQGDKPKELPETSSSGIETYRSGDGVFRVDRTGKGAILCTWSIFEAIRAVGQECYKGQDVAFQAELDRSLERIDEFIIKNSKHPVTKGEIEAERAQNLQKLRSGWYMCIGHGPKMYEDLRKKGPDTLNVQTTDLLSIPREPVMNPCM